MYVVVECILDSFSAIASAVFHYLGLSLLLRRGLYEFVYRACLSTMDRPYSLTIELHYTAISTQEIQVQRFGDRIALSI